MAMAKLGVTGTSGRGVDGQRLTLAHWGLMMRKATKAMESLGGPEKCMLLTEAGPWAGHIAVTISELSGAKLAIFLPCPFDIGEMRFEDNGIKGDFRRNPGGLCNYYHHTFTQKTKFRSLKDISEALARPNTTAILPEAGTDCQSLRLAKEADILLSFTFDETEPTPLEAKRPWDSYKALGKKMAMHIQLNE